MQTQRSELRNQLRTLEGTRQGIRSELSRAPSPAERTGLEKRLASVDERISDVDRQIAAADAAVAKAAAVPGAVVVVPSSPRDRGPTDREAILMTFAMIFVIMLPLSIGLARRLWRRNAAAPMAIPDELNTRMQGIERTVESIAVEIERIGEGQRFVTKLYAGQAGQKALQEESVGHERPPR
jgi:hypothetical protein